MRDHGTVIVKRKSRHKGEGHHGGAWKVAFADFALAMMALFMVLWILAVSSEQERETISSQLRDYSVFEGSSSPYLLGGTPFPADLQGQPVAQIPGQATQLQDVSLASQPLLSLDDLRPGRVESEQDKRRLAILIGQLAERQGMEDNLQLDVVPEGLRIQIHDHGDKPMFDRGSARLAGDFEQLLKTLAPVFEKVENRLLISGHTDSVRYVSQHYSNWDLSGARAQNVRQLLQLAGVPAGRVLQVVAMADQAPFNLEDPTSGDNRRVELMLLSEQAEQLLLQLYEAGLPGGVFDKQAQRAQLENTADNIVH
ncbi:putative lateral flagellar export/assembly protein LafU [Oceanisphaera sediminis]|uniref:Lateral flagellar export/assembly protein LafU n=1 Tax=Oceanisphaera sediminis TaxID=981381 RepID=A0ABP7DEV5_9GAMM